MTHSPFTQPRICFFPQRKQKKLDFAGLKGTRKERTDKDIGDVQVDVQKEKEGVGVSTSSDHIGQSGQVHLQRRLLNSEESGTRFGGTDRQSDDEEDEVERELDDVGERPGGVHLDLCQVL